jgi:hypothetical protein
MGIRTRSLRRLESGERVPAAATLERLLNAMGASEADAHHVRRLHAEAIAEREGTAVAQRDAHQLERLGERLTATAVHVLRRQSLAVTDHHSRQLRAAFVEVLGDVLDPPAKKMGE